MTSAGARADGATVGGISAAALAAQHGTPLFAYDGDRVLERVAAIRAAIPWRPLRLLYSAKANPAVAIAALLREAGVGLDACSPGDLELAARAGFAAEEISYTGFGSTDEELRAAAHAGTLVLDDAGEVERLAALGGAREIGLRVNPGIDAGFHSHVRAGARDAKFGIALASLARVCAHARAHGMPVTGLHAHLGSDVLDVGPHVELLQRLCDAARGCEELAWINLGGGWGTPRGAGEAPYDWPAFGRAAQRLLSELPAPLELRLEPGGHLLMDAGFLLTSVVAVREASCGRPRTAAVDASTNQLVSVLLYDARHTLELGRPAAGEAPVAQRIAGNLMQAGDVLAESVELPPLRPGDVLAIGQAGAYAACRAGVFNERPRAAEVLVRDGTARLIRRAETVQELFARDLPA